MHRDYGEMGQPGERDVNLFMPGAGKQPFPGPATLHLRKEASIV